MAGDCVFTSLFQGAYDTYIYINYYETSFIVHNLQYSYINDELQYINISNLIPVHRLEWKFPSAHQIYFHSISQVVICNLHTDEQQ